MNVDRKRLKTSLLLIGAIGFATLAQVYFFWRRDYVWDGVLFLSVALICFVLLTRSTRVQGIQTTHATRAWFDRLRQGQIDGRLLMICLAGVLNWLAARSANTQPPPPDYTVSVLLWLASLLFLYLSVVPAISLVQSVRRSSLSDALRISVSRSALRATRNISRRSREITLVIALVLIGFLLRAWDLEHIPANFSGDEGTQGMWAVDALLGRLRNPFATGWFTVPTMSFFAQAASLRLFGDSVAGFRILSALTGSATLLFTYLLARRTLGRRVALFALATLTFNHYHIHFSRLGSNQIADPLFMVLTLWLLIEGLRRSEGSRRCHSEHKREETAESRDALHWFFAAGLAMGLSWYGYFGSRVILLVVAIYLGLQARTRRGFVRAHARAMALLTLTALMAASPLLAHFLQHPEEFSARFNQVSFFRWLGNELQRPDHDSAFALVLRQVWLSVSAFNYTLDPTFWYRAQIPLLDFVSGILFLFGLLIAMRRRRIAAVGLILLWFGMAITFGWVLTENPPSSMRMVIIAPAVALLAALGLDGLLALIRRAFGGHREQWTRVGLMVTALAAIFNVYYYFAVYTPSRVYGNPTAETATALARHLNRSWATTIGPPKSSDAQPENDPPFVYFYGPPFMYYEFGTIQFIARDVPGVSVPARRSDPDYDTPVVGRTLFVVLRERLDELNGIQARYPGGRVQHFHSEADGRLMFVIYEIQQKLE